MPLGTFVPGSKDGKLKVWSFLHGTLVTMFDLHEPVVDFYITPNAAHIVVKLSNSCHVPLMCLHNTPAGELKANSQISMSLSGGKCAYSI